MIYPPLMVILPVGVIGMRISPLEIEQQTFNKALRGFDPVEVATYLESLAREFEALIAENAELREQVKVLTSKLSGYEDIEKTLQETLLTSQKTAEEAKRNIQKEADLVIKQAQLERQQILEEARTQLSELNRKIAELQMAKEKYLSEFKAFLGAQWHLLENIDAGPAPPRMDSPSRRRRIRPQGEDLERLLDDLERMEDQKAGESGGESSAPDPGSMMKSPPADTGGQDEQAHREDR
jgi:cell division initiation protein